MWYLIWAIGLILAILCAIGFILKGDQNEKDNS